MSTHDLLERARSAFWLRRCDAVGDHARVHGRPTVTTSGGQIRIGARFRLASRPAPSHLSTGPLGVLEIGRDVSIGHGAAIAAYESVRIGDGTLVGPFAIILDTNFHGAAGDQSIRHDCRPVAIGAGCRIGSRVTIMPGASIGDGAEILAGSVVSSAIPAGVCAGGARARILGRAGEAASRWDGAAASVSNLVMQVFGLDAPPDLDTPPCGLPGWNAREAMRLHAAIETRFGVSLGTSALGSALSLAEVAAALERARDTRQARRSASGDTEEINALV